jgi:hypothetical protein
LTAVVESAQPPSEAELTMKLAVNRKSTGRTGRRTLCTYGALLALCSLGLTFGTGCSDTFLQAFGSAASADLQTGLQSILNGVVSGIFTAITPTTTDGSTNNGTSGTTGA